MKKFIFIILLITAQAAAQDIKTPDNFFTPANIKSFADHLFCTRDYLRAVEEYKRYLKFVPDDSIKFKIWQIADFLLKIERNTQES